MSRSRLVRENLYQETPEARAALISHILINGQSLVARHQLQTDEVLNLAVPDGFRAIIYPDSHTPWEHFGVQRAMLDIARYIQPHLAIHIGDFGDFGEISRFPRNVRDGSIPMSTAQELIRRELWEKARAGNPADLIVLGGNHDDRPRQYENNNAPIAGQMLNPNNRHTVMDLVTNILGFKAGDPFTFCWGVAQTGGREGGIRINDSRFRHGLIVDQKPGYSAYRQVLKFLENINMGHVHRAGDFAMEGSDGRVLWGAEYGMSANTKAPGFNYASREDDWMHALGIIQVNNGIVHREVIPALIGRDEQGRKREYFVLLDHNLDPIEFPVYDN